MVHGAPEEVELGGAANDGGGSSQPKVAAHRVSMVRYDWWFHGCAQPG